jgi:hypothetical protein
MNQSPERARQLDRFGVTLIALLAVSITFRALIGVDLQHTSLVFVGLPAMLAWIVASGAPPKTAMGAAMRTTTLALLISCIFLGEAFICVLMAAPVFYLVAALFGWQRSSMDKRGGGPGLTALLIIPLALEGTHPALSVSRDRVVVVEDTVQAPMDEVRRLLAEVPRFDRPLPLFFRLGFPTPGHTHGEGLNIGDERSIVFAHSGHHDGALVMRVVESSPDVIRFAAVSDDSYLTHWLSWNSATVRFAATPSGATRVQWTLRYARRLDPAWYFDPLEKYGVTLAAKYLLATVTTPPTAVTP